MAIQNRIIISIQLLLSGGSIQGKDAHQDIGFEGLWKRDEACMALVNSFELGTGLNPHDASQGRMYRAVMALVKKHPKDPTAWMEVTHRRAMMAF